MKLSNSDPKLAPLVSSEGNIKIISSPEKFIEQEEFEEEWTDNVTSFSPCLRQTLAATGPLIATICSGLTTGYSAVLLPQLNDANSTIPITINEASWIAAMSALPMAPGCILGGLLLQKFGSKISHLILNIIFFIGWIIIGYANDLTMLLIGRFLTGICVGLLGPPAPVYIAETTAPKYRGIFLAGISLAISLGILISHVLGTFLHWKYTAYLCAISPLISILFILLVPESPNYLARTGKLEEAKRSFKWLRGWGVNEEIEWREIRNKNLRVFETKSKEDLKRKESWSKYKKSYFWQPLLIIVSFFFITQFSGVNALAFYSVTIIQDILGTSFNSYLAMIIIDIIRCIMSIVGCVLLRKYSRRSLAVTSGIGTTASLLFLSLFSQLSISYTLPPYFELISLVVLILYICFLSVGLVPLPWMMVGEIFPSSVRSAGTGLSSCFGFVFFFAIVKSGPYLFKDFGTQGTFGFFGAITFFGTIFLYKFLPETKDKTLEQIEDNFVKRNDLN